MFYFNKAICNGIGIGGGIFIGNSGFLIAESTNFSNQFRTRFGMPTQNHGFITLRGFTYTYGVLSIICAIVIFLFKKEHRKKENLDETQNSKLSISNAYKRIWKIFKLKPMRKLILLILTMRVIN